MPCSERLLLVLIPVLTLKSSPKAGQDFARAAVSSVCVYMFIIHICARPPICRHNNYSMQIQGPAKIWMMCCVPELFRHLHAGFRALHFGELLLCGPVSVTAVVPSKWSCVGFQLLVIYLEVCWCSVVAGMHTACVLPYLLILHGLVLNVCMIYHWHHSRCVVISGWFLTHLRRCKSVSWSVLTWLSSCTQNTLEILAFSLRLCKQDLSDFARWQPLLNFTIWHQSGWPWAKFKVTRLLIS